MKRHQAFVVATIVVVIPLVTGCAQPKVLSVKQRKEKLAKEAAVRQGSKLFSKKRCIECHWLGDTGGEIGPDLTHEGSKRDKAWLDTWLKDPASVKPGTKMPKPDLTNRERAFLVEFLASQE